MKFVNNPVRDRLTPAQRAERDRREQLRSKSLLEKIEFSKELISKADKLAKAMKIEHGVYVGFSGGKDSQVLLDLVRSVLPRYYAVHNITTVDPPDNIQFIRKYYPYVFLRHPKETFLQLVARKGMPTINRRYCCQILKEGDSAGEVVLTGVRADESKNRGNYSETMVRSRRVEHSLNHGAKPIEQIMESNHRCIKGKDSVMVYPLLHWSDVDIWNYIEFYGLPVNPCYDVSHRVGCMFCPFATRKELNYYEYTYPQWKQNILKSIQQYMDRNPSVNGSQFQSAEEYYDWWKSKVDVQTWRAKRAQTQLNSGGSSGDFPKLDLIYE